MLQKCFKDETTVSFLEHFFFWCLMSIYNWNDYNIQKISELRSAQQQLTTCWYQIGTLLSV